VPFQNHIRHHIPRYNPKLLFQDRPLNGWCSVLFSFCVYFPLSGFGAARSFNDFNLFQQPGYRTLRFLKVPGNSPPVFAKAIIFSIRSLLKEAVKFKIGDVSLEKKVLDDACLFLILVC
jgi:hypothetical protein